MFFDTPFQYQINLQDSATYGMEMIIQLHNYVMTINTFIISVVVWFFFEIIAAIHFFSFLDKLKTTKFQNTILVFTDNIYKNTKKGMLHMIILEVWWTIIPIIALISIALPSLSMLYYFSLSSKPLITVNVIGHQWYWTYETYYRYNDINDIMNLDNVLTKHVDALKLGYWLVNFFQDNSYASFSFLESAYVADVLTLLITTMDEGYANEVVNNNIHKLIYDSIMIQETDLRFGSLRLLEVDKPLYLPVDVPIRIIFTSADVLHAWAVPALGIKVDCVPGRLNAIEFKIARKGVYYGQCSEICGTQHGFMPICVVGVSLQTYLSLYSD